jgi:DNA-directed RNA polymerase subunit RPC12/RpoP
MNEFLELVTERPNPKLWKKGVFCPYCKSKDVTTFSTRSTLVGYSGKNMNHTHTECRCNKCNKEFTRETKGFDNVWFTASDGKVLLGIPYCFEYYVYTCKHCGGEVIVHHFDNQTNEECKYCLNYKTDEADGKMKPQFYNKFICKSCGKEITSENYYTHAL